MVKRAAGKGFHGERDEERTCSFMQNSHTHSITVPRSPSTITFPSIVSFLKKQNPRLAPNVSTSTVLERLCNQADTFRPHSKWHWETSLCSTSQLFQVQEFSKLYFLGKFRKVFSKFCWENLYFRLGTWQQSKIRRTGRYGLRMIHINLLAPEFGI